MKGLSQQELIEKQFDEFDKRLLILEEKINRWISYYNNHINREHKK